MQKKGTKFNNALSKLLAKLLIFLIKLYKAAFSPWFGRQCKFIPTCSEYAVEAIEKFGPYKGFAMAIWRILKCNPLSKGGVDYPVKYE